MLFAIFCTDKPGSADIRTANRPAHLEYLKAFSRQIVMAGPTQSDDLSTMTGSLLIMDFEDKAAACEFAANDPYAKAGLFESSHVRPWKKVFSHDPT